MRREKTPLPGNRGSTESSRPSLSKISLGGNDHISMLIIQPND